MRPARTTISFSVLFLFLTLAGCGGGSGSGPVTPPNPAPSISSLSPNTTVMGATALTLGVTGSGFISSSTVEWNGAPLATTFLSSTSLQAAVPTSELATAGSFSVTVVTPTPGGGTSTATTFTVTAPDHPAPTISSLSPASASAGGAAFALTVTGANFISSSQIAWNGTPTTTMFVSSTSLTTQIAATQISTAGTAIVTVVTPAPGGGTSNAENFLVTAVPAAI